MASLTDIANSILNDLDAIQGNTSNTNTSVLQVKGDTSALNLKTNTLISVCQNGFFNLSQGLAAMIQQQVATNDQLKHQSEQNDTIICWLKTIASLLCEIKRQLEAANAELKDINAAIELLEAIMELVHGSEAVEVQARKQLEARIEKCCPQNKPDPKPCFDPCADPKSNTPPVPKSDYTPLPKPQEPGSSTGNNPG